MDPFKKIDDILIAKGWEHDLKTSDRAGKFRIKSLRVLFILFRAFRDEELTLRSMSLVYTTLLALVPLLAFSFSVLKAFGVHAKMEILLYQLLEPLGPKGVDLALRIIGFVENINVGVLGSIGLLLLIYTLISQIQKLENALNTIWSVRASRNFSQRFSNYMSVLLVGPVLIFSAIGITATLMSSTLVKKVLSIGAMGDLAYVIGRLVPYVLAILAFTLIYIFLPNTKVKAAAALIGGVFAGILWKITGLAFASFVVTSAKYSKIYSGFAVVIFFLLWLYWSWLILLVGARVAAYFQHPDLFDPRRTEDKAGKRFHERVALIAMFLIGYNFYHNKSPWDFDSLAERLGCSGNVLHRALSSLEKGGLIMTASGDNPVYLPGRDTETITVKDVLDSVRLPEEDSDTRKKAPPVPEVDEALEKMERALSDSVGKDTVKDLILSHTGDL
jgi:membrane protein